MEQDTSSPTTTQAIQLKKEKVIKGITCPSCGGALDLKEGIRTFNCKYCGTLLVTKGEEGAIKYYVPRKINRDDAIKRAYNWLGTGLSKAKGLKANSKIDEAFLTYIPYWRVKADIVGWIFGQEKHTSNSGSTYEDKEIKIQRTYDSTFPACDVAELGVKHVNLTGDEILPVNFDDLQTQGMVFNIVSSEKEIVDKAREYFTNSSKKDSSLSEIYFEHFDIVRQQIGIVYYPLWVIRYVFANRTYQVVVDGEDGSICYGKAPGSTLFRAISGIFATAVGMYLATFFEVFKFFKASSKFPWIAYIILLILGIALMSWGYKKFRYGGELEEGTGLAEGEGSQVSLVKDFGSISSSIPEGVKDIAKGAAAASIAGAVLGSIFDDN